VGTVHVSDSPLGPPCHDTPRLPDIDKDEAAIHIHNSATFIDISPFLFMKLALALWLTSTST
jgi:hypothetical protein